MKIDRVGWERGFAVVAMLAVVCGLLPGDDLPRPLVEPPVPVVLPVPWVQVLPNGMKVVLIERRSIPIVTLNAMVMTGAEADPRGRAGTAQWVAGLLTEGTTDRTAFEIAQAVDQAGGTINTGAGWDKSFASVSVLSDHKELAFDVLSDAMMRPAFAPSEIARIQKQTLSALRVLWRDPRYVADSTIHFLLFGNTPYGHPDDGTAASIMRITRQDLVTFHSRYYRPGNTILAVEGDISPEESLRLARRYFGPWQAREAAGLKEPAPAAREPARTVLVVDKPDAVQTEIRVGNPGVPRSSDDFYALTVGNQVLGGPAANLLFLTLRTERGLTYGASSNLDYYRSVGGWIAKTSTRTPDTVKALQLTLDQMKNLQEHPVTPAQLRMAKNYLIGHQALQFESLDGIASHTLELMLYGLPLNYWSLFPQQIERLTPSDILGATSRYLHPERADIVLVGNAAGFEKHLKKFGRVRVVPMTQLHLGSLHIPQGSDEPPLPGR